MNQNSPIHQLLFSTLRIEAISKEDTISFGTSFIIFYEKQGMTFPFVVTNKHVIDKAREVKFFLSASDGQNPIIGKKIDVSITEAEKLWFQHPGGEDVVIMPFLPLLQKLQKEEKVPYFKAITSSLIPNKDDEEKLTALEEIIFIGYPNALYDSKNLFPIIRRGVTATPVFMDYNGDPKFLIDASVFPGSSGSPVLIYNFGNYTTADGNTTIGSRLYFIGIISSVVTREDSGALKIIEVPTQMLPTITVKQMIDLGVVIKAAVIVETIEAFLKEYNGEKEDGTK